MGGGNDAPDQRDPVEDYRRGIDVYLKSLPRLLEAESGARTSYDPERVEQALALEEAYDPNRARIRTQMGESIAGDLEAGYALPPGLSREIQQATRGAQSARGNIYGGAAANEEAFNTGTRAFDIYNRRLANAGTFLGMPSPAQPDRTAAYTSGGFSTGGQIAGLGQQAYQNALAGYNAQGNPWANALAGAASGYAAGGGGWTGLAMGAAGGVGGNTTLT